VGVACLHVGVKVVLDVEVGSAVGMGADEDPGRDQK